jgi:hypothetical protein
MINFYSFFLVLEEKYALQRRMIETSPSTTPGLKKDTG